jgi:hypothetical protein
MSTYDYYDAETGAGLTDYELHARFDDWLDELGPAIIAGHEYSASYALRAVSDIDYRVSYCDWLDGQLCDGQISEDAPEIDGSVCADCLMAIANGDRSGIDDVAAWEERVAATDATENGQYVVYPVGPDSYFGSAPCSYCGTGLAGDRYDVAFMAATTR